MTARREQRVVMTDNQVLNIGDAPGTRIRCERGLLWITQDRDRRDVVLAHGESFVVDRRGACVLMALQSRTLVNISEPVAARHKAWWQSLIAAFGRVGAFRAIQKGVAT